MTNNKRLYKIKFINQNQVYELYAKSVYSSDIYGFVTVSELVFDRSEGLVIDPTEEKLKEEFSNVNALHLPHHHVLRIEEVKDKQTCSISRLKTEGNVTALPNTPGIPK